MCWRALSEQNYINTIIIIETCLKTCASLLPVCHQFKKPSKYITGAIHCIHYIIGTVLILYDIIQYTILYYTMLYTIIQYYTKQFYTMLYYTRPIYNIILYHIIPYNIIYYAMLYYTI